MGILLTLSFLGVGTAPLPPKKFRISGGILAVLHCIEQIRIGAIVEFGQMELYVSHMLVELCL